MVGSNLTRVFFLSCLIIGLIALDLLSKNQILEMYQQGHLPIVVCPIFNLSLAWNPGISFNFLAGAHEKMPYILAGVSSVVSIGLFIWMVREKLFMLQTGFAFIIAGGLANAYDRIAYGAVVDFLQFHYLEYYFPTFNVADICINIGVGLVLLDIFVLSRHRT